MFMLSSTNRYLEFQNKSDLRGFLYVEKKGFMRYNIITNFCFFKVTTMGLFSKLFSKDELKETGKAKDANEGLEVSFSVPNHVKVNSTIYLQDRLSKLIGNSVNLQLVPISKAKRPEGWDDIRGECAVVDSSFNLYGVLFEYNLDKVGYRIGDWVDCLITKTSHGNVELWMPISAKKILEQESLLSFNTSQNNIKTLFPSDEVQLSGCAIDTIPPKEGSKAKPKICIKDAEGNVIVEISGRSIAYADLEPWVGKTAKVLKVYKKKSQFSEEEYYYHFWLSFI